MAKIEFGERSGEYFQELKMQEFIIKCDICLEPMEKDEKVSLTAHLHSVDEMRISRAVVFNLNDICHSCSIDLAKILEKFIYEKKAISEINEEK